MFSSITCTGLQIKQLYISCLLIEYKLLTLVHKVLNRNHPEYLRDLLQLYKPNRSLCSVSRYVITLMPLPH